jgi:hypothetical protein
MTYFGPAFGLLPKRNIPDEEPMGMRGKLWEVDGKYMMRFRGMPMEWIEVERI